jgi:hypothetical protein
MHFARRHERMFGTARSARTAPLGCRGLCSLLLLLIAAGCFQPDEGLDDTIYPPWNPPPPQQLDAALQPVVSTDAAVIGAPPVAQDAAALQPPGNPGLDAAVPGFVGVDASNPGFAFDGGSVDAGRLEDAALVPDVGPIGPPPTMLRFSVLTKSLGGRYAPRNIGAIWIENAAGKWIKTLAVWAFIRERYLTRFRTASGGNRVDAMTSATLSQHATHNVTWDFTDATDIPVPDGDYRVIVETTDRDATGDSTEVAFIKGALPVRIMPPDTTHYVNMSLALE